MNIAEGQTRAPTFLTWLVPLALVPLLVAVALPSMAPTPDSVSDDIRVPRAGLAMYQPRTGDMVLGFDAPVSLADGWRGTIGIRALGGPEPVVLDGLGEGAYNIMGPDDSCIIMVQLGHADRMALLGAITMTVVMEAGAVTGPGGAANHHTTMPVEMTS